VEKKETKHAHSEENTNELRAALDEALKKLQQ
jgi:hypothetical protein